MASQKKRPQVVFTAFLIMFLNASIGSGMLNGGLSVEYSLYKVHRNETLFSQICQISSKSKHLKESSCYLIAVKLLFLSSVTTHLIPGISEDIKMNFQQYVSVSLHDKEVLYRKE